MRMLGRKLKHDGHEYYLLEDGWSLSTRAVVVLCRPTNPHFKSPKPPPPVRLPEPGSWQAVARWEGGELHVAVREHVERAELLSALLEEYETTAKRPPPVAWALADDRDDPEGERNGNFHGSLVPALPMGVAVHCFDDEAAAQAAADGRALVAIDDQARFLNQMVRLGYAGALWNGTLPVFFCVDDDGALHYLRVSPRKRDVKLQILDETDRWDTYEGAEEIQFLDNGEACDERLVTLLGDRPVLAWPADGVLHGVGPVAGEPGLLQVEVAEGDEPADGDGLPYAVLFSDAARAEAFRDDLDPDWVTYPVDDLGEFLGRSDLAGCAVQLNPGSHRSEGGLLWRSGDEVVLDSFSGFWKLGPDGFVSAE